MISSNKRQWKDRMAGQLMFFLCLVFLSFAILIVFSLYYRARPVLASHSLKDLLFSANWHPAEEKFGLANFIAGTIWVTGIAMVIAIPFSILTAIYLSEIASRRGRELIKPIIDVLAGISPVIYGVWGMMIVVPFVRDSLMPLLSERLPFFPFLSDNYTGFCVLSAGVVLAVMTFPIIISIVEEVLRNVPFEVRESSLALGATRWQTVKGAVLKKAWPGVIAAVILGLSRALGETIAVLMVAGCALQGFPRSIFDPAYPLPALIANTYGEMMSVPLYDSAILLAAFILLIMTVVSNMIGWWILFRMERSEAAWIPAR